MYPPREQGVYHEIQRHAAKEQHRVDPWRKGQVHLCFDYLLSHLKVMQDKKRRINVFEGG